MNKKTTIVIDRQRLGKNLPAIVTITPDGPEYGDEVIIRDEHGVEIVRVTGVAMGKEPEAGSARIWLETTLQAEIRTAPITENVDK